MVQWVNDPVCLCGAAGSIPSLVLWAKDLASLQLCCRSRLCLGFDSWSGNFHTLQVWPKKKKKEPPFTHRFPQLSIHTQLFVSYPFLKHVSLLLDHFEENLKDRVILPIHISIYEIILIEEATVLLSHLENYNTSKNITL